MDLIFSNFLTLLAFIFALGLIIGLHEFGHLIVAKMCGVYCFEFAIGFGPKIFSFRYRDTDYSLRLIPLGGFVAMAGESELNENYIATHDLKKINEKNTINGIHPFKRILVQVAGVFFNFILAYILIVIVLLNNPIFPKESAPIVNEVVKDSPAEKAGIMPGDTIESIYFEDGFKLENIKTFNEISPYIANKGGNISLTINRADTSLKINLKALLNENNTYYIGIKVANEFVKINFSNVFYYSFIELITIFKMIFISLINLFKGIGLNQLGGPIAIYKVTNQAVSLGASVYLKLIALLSINVGIFNLLPVPALDGGRIIMSLYELISGKQINKKVEQFLIISTMILLLALFAILMLKDIFVSF